MSLDVDVRLPVRSRLPVRLLTSVQSRPVLLLVAAAASWGIGTVIAKQAVAEVPPLSLLVVQLASSVLFLLVVGRLRGEGLPRDRSGVLLGRLGLLNPGLSYALSLVGLTSISASLAVLLWAGEPILIVALAALVLRERLSIGAAVASGAAIAGLILVVADPLTTGSVAGIALTVAGVAVCAVYSVAARGWLPGSSDSTLGVVLAQQLHALGLAAVVVAGLAVGGQPVVPSRLSVAGVASAVSSGLLYYAVAYLFYLTALRQVRASVAAMSFYLIPVFGLAGGALLGERLLPVQWIGAVVVVVAVALVTSRAGTQPATGPDEPQPSSAASSAQMATTPRASSRS